MGLRSNLNALTHPVLWGKSSENPLSTDKPDNNLPTWGSVGVIQAKR